MDTPVHILHLAPVAPDTKQYGFPEVRHHRNVRVQPGDFSYLGERLGQDVVDQHSAVETP
jgi:hypothetical protein